MTQTGKTFYRDAAEAMEAGARFCYFIPATGQDDPRGYVPSAVFENTPGHYPMAGNGDFAKPWYWGKTYAEAKRTADEANAQRGLTDDDVVQIIGSSIAAG